MCTGNGIKRDGEGWRAAERAVQPCKGAGSSRKGREPPWRGKSLVKSRAGLSRCGTSKAEVCKQKFQKARLFSKCPEACSLST